MRIIVSAALALVPAAVPAAAQVNHAGADTSNVWSYAGPTGPPHWARVYSAECGAERQSPVDLAARRRDEPLRVAAAYAPWADGSVYNNGHSVSVRAGAPGALTIGDSVFALVEMHLHVPSEHTVRGRRFAGEAHLVHEHAGGGRAVLATLLVEGEEDPAWNALVAALPGHEGQRNALAGEVDLHGMLRLGGLGAEWIYDYAGSLTTPPCDQNVRWLVRAAPLAVSRAQIEAFSSAMVRNARPLQPANRRTVRLRRGP